jgi:serine/threonine protein kinase
MSYKYEVIRELGAGGFSTVFKAMEKDIAHKVIYIKDASHKEEIKREITNLQNLQHKNIVKHIGFNLVTSNDNF